MSEGFEGTKPKSGGNSPRLSELVELYTLTSEYVQVRFFPEVTSYYVFWINVKTREGTKSNAFPKICLDYNPETEEFDQEICPYRKNQVGRGQKRYLANAIIRTLQENEPKRIPKHSRSERKPEKGTDPAIYRKDPDSHSWTPVRVLYMPPSVVTSLQNLKALNRHKGKQYDITHPKYGADVYLRFNDKAEGSKKYDVQLAEQSRLSSKELAYLRYQIKGIMNPESQAEAEAEYQSIKGRIWGREGQNVDKADREVDYYDNDSSDSTAGSDPEDSSEIVFDKDQQEAAKRFPTEADGKKSSKKKSSKRKKSDKKKSRKS